MTRPVEIKDVPTEHVVAARTHTPFAQLGATFSGVMSEIVDHIGPLGKWPTGAPFAIYYNQPFNPSDVDVEIGVPVASDVFVLDDEHALVSRDVAGTRVAATTYQGPYGGIGAAYEDLFQWLAEHDLEVTGPPREIYIVGPGQTERPAEYVTEIDVPIR